MTRLNTKLFSHTRKYSTFSIFWVEEKPGDVCTTQMQKVKTAEFISFFYVLVSILEVQVFGTHSV